MNEFALMKDGKIANVVSTPRAKDKVQAMYPGYEVKHLDDVPDAVKVMYQYWNERP